MQLGMGIVYGMVIFSHWLRSPPYSYIFRLIINHLIFTVWPWATSVRENDRSTNNARPELHLSSLCKVLTVNIMFLVFLFSSRTPWVPLIYLNDPSQMFIQSNILIFWYLKLFENLFKAFDVIPKNKYDCHVSSIKYFCMKNNIKILQYIPLNW